MATAVTPVGVRDGDPEALAGLCDRRGPAVLAYCEVVAGQGDEAVVAAADAFASFRAGVVAAPDLAGLNPEALLISATRHAAARHAGTDLPPEHARVPALLAARADRSITLADHDWLEEHLAGCWTCRAPVARFEAADRAYRDPPSSPLPPAVSAAIVAALTAAAPVLGDLPPEPEPAASMNGAIPHADAQPDAQHAGDAAAPGEGYVDQPTAAYQLGDLDFEGQPQPQAAEPEPDPAAAGHVAERTPLLGSRRLSRRPRSDAAERKSRRARLPVPTDAPQPEAAPVAPVAAAADEQRPGRGTSLPRPERVAVVTGGRSRSPLRLGVVLPVAIVILVIVIALLIAGVFGGGGGGSGTAATPSSLVPASDGPAATNPAPVIDVPDAATATAAQVERAKARARAAARRAKEGERPTTTTTATTATPPAAPPAQQAASKPATSATAATPARKPAATATPSTQTAGPVKVKAGDGATGAEQIPTKKNTATVPDLAPPVEPEAPPG
ncbi:MAG TPA: hypothetical protein VGF63_04995 [Solirubrobacteraceae bacterium]